MILILHETFVPSRGQKNRANQAKQRYITKPAKQASPHYWTSKRYNDKETAGINLTSVGCSLIDFDLWKPQSLVDSCVLKYIHIQYIWSECTSSIFTSKLKHRNQTALNATCDDICNIWWYKYEKQDIFCCLSTSQTSLTGFLSCQWHLRALSTAHTVLHCSSSPSPLSPPLSENSTIK